MHMGYKNNLVSFVFLVVNKKAPFKELSLLV